MAKVGPKNGERGGGLQECYVIFKGGYSKVLRGVTGGRGGVNFALKKRYVIFERPLSDRVGVLREHPNIYRVYFFFYTRYPRVFHGAPSTMELIFVASSLQHRGRSKIT